jgi:hypothetical protein
MPGEHDGGGEHQRETSTSASSCCRCFSSADEGDPKARSPTWSLMVAELTRHLYIVEGARVQASIIAHLSWVKGRLA